MDSESDVSLPLLEKIAKILQLDSTMKISHHSLILEVLNSCNQGSINIFSQLAQGPKLAPRKKRSKSRLSKKARDDFVSLTDYQTYTQNLTFKIRDHFSEVVIKIADYLKLGDDHGEPQIWASYEALFFTSTILPDIEKLYVLAYDGDAKLLQMLLPTANPRNMKLRGEWVIDILDSVKFTRPGTTEKATHFDPTSSDEEVSGSSRRGITPIARKGFNRQAFRRQAKTVEDLDTNPGQGQHSNQTVRGATSGDVAKDHHLYYVDSVSHISLASNLVEEMENLYPFLRDETLGSTDLSNLHTITPEPQIDHIKQKSQVHSVKQCVPPNSKSQTNCSQIVPERPVNFEDMFSHPSGELVIEIIDTVKTTRPGTVDPTSLDQEDADTSRSGATSTARQGFNRQAKALEDLDQGQHCNQTLRGATSGVGAEEHQLYYADSVSHVSLASNLVEEMENLYTFLRDETLGSIDLSNLPTITPEPQIDQIVQKSKVQSGKLCLPPNSKSRKNRKEIVPDGPVSFEDMFSRAYKCLRMVIQESLPLMKLRWLVMCLQAVCDSLKERLSCKLGGKDRSISTDDLIPSLILFLIKGNPGEVTALYPQLKFLEDYLPDIVAAGIIGFTVTQFSVAFAVIIETDDVDIYA